MPCGEVEHSRIAKGRSSSTLRFGSAGGTVVLVCSLRDPTTEEWTTWSNYYADAVLEWGLRKLFMLSAGGGPNARQRKEVVSDLARRLGADVLERLAIATCGNSPTVRVVATALGWLGGIHRVKAFRDDERARALAYLDVPPQQRAHVLRLAKHLEAEFASGPVGPVEGGEVGD